MSRSGLELLYHRIIRPEPRLTLKDVREGNPYKIKELRLLIDRILRHDPMKLRHIPGMSLVYAPEERPLSETCFLYALAEELSRSPVEAESMAEKVMHELGFNFHRTSMPAPHDVAAYYMKRIKTSHLNHVGKVVDMTADNIPVIESRFGQTGVYRHLPWQVPTIYGETLVFYRKKQG